MSKILIKILYYQFYYKFYITNKNILCFLSLSLRYLFALPNARNVAINSNLNNPFLIY